ncbi:MULTISPECIES: RDD family protein [Rodentibacter]|uniref:RDD family protein n=1 Tax=Rodentibacter TaxID=1960084 RepID=UPI001CFED55B|nr:RDD family protein [Rodentibacter sp. JRC1]GJI54894.1 hypothetical protein HEMROJRC1_00060 [Rodentibacter sp. JRC1]
MLVEDPKNNEFSSSFQSLYLVPASRFKRWLASIINGIVLWVMVAIGLLFGDFTGVFFTILYVGLQLYFMKTYGQTMAKRWLSLRVLDNNTQRPIEFGKYIGREMIDLLLAWTSFLLIISGIVALIRDDRRSLTDLIIGSQVIQEQKQ